MRTFVFISALLLLANCASEQSKEKASEKETDEKKIPEENQNDFHAKSLSLKNNSVPFINSFDETLIGKIEFRLEADSNVVAEITHSDITTELNLDLNELIPQIATLAYSNNYHQQLSVYLFEKQNHSVKVEVKNIHPSISYYELVNPPRGKNWFLNAIKSEN
jgi:hypothetical protein